MIFGGEKFVATIPWRKRTAKSDVPHYLSQDYEWVLCYANEGFAAGIQKEFCHSIRIGCARVTL